ncbi:MAG: nodulation protein NfeD [Chloroflexota bacterium]
MSKSLRVFAIGLIVLAFALPVSARAQTGAHIDVITVTGAIDTWIDAYVSRGIGLAEQDGAEALVIVLNTPGGALNATQNITTRMLNARVPIVVFVHPQGAWAGSAGTFITMAANIAAMAPGTTIGAAHPVDSSGQDIPGDARDKVTNFSVSIIQGIAKQRGRNADWAGKAVKESLAATAQEALDLKVIDLMANDLNDLLNKMDGKPVKTAAGEIILKTQRAGINPIDMNLPELVLHTLVDPTIAAFLLSLGLLALVVEVYNPGATFPAVVGVICLVFASVALGSLPFNWGGVILIVLSVITFAIDVKVNSVVLTGGAVVMFVLGAMLLFMPLTPQPPTMPAISVSPWFILAMAGAMTAFFLFILGAAVRGHRYPVLSGAEAMIGATGIALSDIAPSGLAYVKGEDWSAEAQEGSIQKGEAVKVVQVEGLRLKVVKK